MSEMKRCTVCGNEYPATVENFGLKSANKNGLRAECKKCQKESRKRRYQENIEKEREAARKYNKEHREEKIQYQIKYKNANRDRLNQKSREYRRANAQKISEYNKRYKREHAEEIRAYDRKIGVIKIQKRKARMAKVLSLFTIEQWERCREHFDNKCAYCGKEKPLAQEHFLALSKGGEFAITNIVPACKTCNSSKGVNDFFEWYPKQKFYNKKSVEKILKYLNYDLKTKVQQLIIF